eukprot:13980410-Alexandrium_andersonii.AAC.1
MLRRATAARSADAARVALRLFTARATAVHDLMPSLRLRQLRDQESAASAALAPPLRLLRTAPA